MTEQIPSYIESSEFAGTFLQHLKERAELDSNYGYRTGIPDIDQLIWRFEPGWFVVVGGPPKGGKTALLTTLANVFAGQGARILSVQAEMGILGTGYRMFANISNVDMSKFRRAQLDEMEWELIHDAHDSISNYNIAYTSSAITVDQIATLTNVVDPDIIMVDYIQLLRDPKARGRVEEIENISRALKLLANTGARPRLVVAASQFSREINKAGDFKSAHGFKGSGGIENDTDFAITMAPVYDVSGQLIPNRKELWIPLSRWSEADQGFTVYFSGMHAKIGGLCQEEIEMFDVTSPEAFWPDQGIATLSDSFRDGKYSIWSSSIPQ